MSLKNFLKTLFIFSLCFFTLSTPTINADTSVLEEKEWFNPVEIGEFLDFFAEMEYGFSTAVHETTVSYLFEETEEIDGEEVSRIQLKSVSEDQEFSFLMWIDQENNVLRVQDKASGEDVPPMFANMMTGAILIPFTTIGELDIKEALTEDYEGVVVELIDTSEKTINGLEATVFTYEVEYLDEEFTTGTATYKAADFGDFQMLIHVHIPEYKDPEIEFLEYNLKNVSLH